jgi:hypothetical protein
MDARPDRVVKLPAREANDLDFCGIKEKKLYWRNAPADGETGHEATPPRQGIWTPGIAGRG